MCAQAAGFTEAPAETSSAVFADFAPALGEAFARARAGGRELYGFANHELVSTYVGTSTGLRLRHDQPNGHAGAQRQVPGPAPGRRGPGAPRGTSRTSTRRRWTRSWPCAWAGPSGAIELPAGRYETLLPPTAVADLLIYQMWSASGRDAVEGRTVFSKPGGGTRVGEKLSELPLTLRSDPNEPGLESAPFVIAHASGGDPSVFDNGLPLAATEWMREGELRASDDHPAQRGPDRPAGGAPASTTSSWTGAGTAPWTRWSAGPPSAACC